MANMTLRALASEWGKAGEAEMDHLTVQSGFLQVAESIPSSHGAMHKFKKVDALPSFAFIAPDGSMGDVTVENDVFSLPLKIVQADQSEPANIMVDWPGGTSAYFASNRPAFLESFGQKASVTAFYGTNAAHGDVEGPIGLHQIAKANSKRVQCGGGSGSSSTIFAVKFRSGSNGCGLLYDSNVTGAGSIMKSEVLNGGKKVLEVTNTSGALKKLVYQVVHQGKFAFLSTSQYDVATMTQIQDSSTYLPTAVRIDELLDLVRADGRTFLFMNRTVRRMVQKLNASALSTTPQTTDFYSWIMSWNGTPIIIDDNILSTEASTLD